MAGNRRNTPIEFTVRGRVGTIATYKSGWTKELNVIEWNGNTAKFDIRDWDKAHEHMSRSITLHESEAKELMYLLMARFGIRGEEVHRVNPFDEFDAAQRRSEGGGAPEDMEPRFEPAMPSVEFEFGGLEEPHENLQGDMQCDPETGEVMERMEGDEVMERMEAETNSELADESPREDEPEDTEEDDQALF